MSRKNNDNPSLQDLRRVEVHFLDRVREHDMHKADVDAFVRATLELHVEPGINPHNRAETSPVWQISVFKLHFAKPYWWTTPGLKANHEESGASILVKDDAALSFYRDPEELKTAQEVRRTAQKMFCAKVKGDPAAALADIISQTLADDENATPEFRSLAALDRTMLLTGNRVRELILLAKNDPAQAIESCVRDVRVAIKTGKPVPATFNSRELDAYEASQA